MEEGLKHKAYLEGMKLKKAGYDNEVIFARLEKQGNPEELISQVIMNLSVQQKIDVIKELEPFFNSAILKIAIGVFIVVLSAVFTPDHIILPVGLIFGGIIYAIIVKSRMKA